MQNNELYNFLIYTGLLKKTIFCDKLNKEMFFKKFRVLGGVNVQVKIHKACLALHNLHYI